MGKDPGDFMRLVRDTGRSLMEVGRALMTCDDAEFSDYERMDMAARLGLADDFASYVCSRLCAGRTA